MATGAEPRPALELARIAPKAPGQQLKVRRNIRVPRLSKIDNPMLADSTAILDLRRIRDELLWPGGRVVKTDDRRLLFLILKLVSQ